MEMMGLETLKGWGNENGFVTEHYSDSTWSRALFTYTYWSEDSFYDTGFNYFIFLTHFLDQEFYLELFLTTKIFKTPSLNAFWSQHSQQTSSPPEVPPSSLPLPLVPDPKHSVHQILLFCHMRIKSWHLRVPRYLKSLVQFNLPLALIYTIYHCL